MNLFHICYTLGDEQVCTSKNEHGLCSPSNIADCDADNYQFSFRSDCEALCGVCCGNSNVINLCSDSYPWVCAIPLLANDCRKYCGLCQD